jgi:hypothetical protein
MRYLQSLLALALILLLNQLLPAQDMETPEGYIADWAAQLQPVSTGELEISHQLAADPNMTCRVIYTIQSMDLKNNRAEERYEFNLADIDAKSVKYRVVKKVIFLDLKVTKNQRLIKYYKDGVQQDYVSALQMPAFDSDNAQILQGIIQGAARNCTERKMQWFEPADLETMLQAICQHGQSMKYESASYQTSLTLNKDYPTRMRYLIEQKSGKGSPSVEVYEFNLADLDEKTVQIQVTGVTIAVEMKTERRQHYVEHYLGEVQQNYTDGLKIQVQEIEQAKALVALLQTCIPLSKIRMAEQMPGGQNLDAAFAALQGLLSKGQSINGNCLSMLSQTSSDGKTLDSFRFYFSDFESSDIQIKVQRKEIWVEASVAKRLRMIEHHRDNTRQNYTSELKIFTPNLEIARSIQHQFIQLASLCLGVPDSDQLHKTANSLLLFDLLSPLIRSCEVSGSTVQQQLKTIDEERRVCKLQLTQVSGTGKKRSEMVYEFLLSDLNPKAVSLYIQGKDIAIDLEVHKREKLIKSYKDGEPAVYTQNIRIWMPNLETARMAHQTIQSSLHACNP